jgi:acetylornithine/N-succinyldiaminopimelate aminotransferase
MEHAASVGVHFRSGLNSLKDAVPGRIKEVRGAGLMVGVELFNPEAKLLLMSLLEQGIVANAVGDTVLRFVPPLVVTNHDCDRVVAALRTALG